MSLISMIRGARGATGFGYASTAEQVVDGLSLEGKTFLITGINSGIGRESGRVLAQRGARILGAARTEAKAVEALQSFAHADTHVPLVCELSEAASVRGAVDKAKQEGPIDVLLCNAGIMALGERQVKHGLEMQFLTNHVGHFILVTGLLEQLTADGRVVMLSSEGHRMAPTGGIHFDDLSLEGRYNRWTSYGQSKLANLLFAKALATRVKPGQTSNAVHPGVINTNLGRHMPAVMRVAFPFVAAKTIPEGAATQVYVAAHPDAAAYNGEYFANCNLAKASKHGCDPELAERLWSVTQELVAGMG